MVEISKHLAGSALNCMQKNDDNLRTLFCESYAVLTWSEARL